MGNANQPQMNNATNTLLKNSQKNNTSKNIINDDDVFNKISSISTQLLVEFNSDFLKEDFCSKLSLIFEKKLSNFNVKLLKTIYDQMNKKDTNNEMLMTIQYLPKNDEQFEDLNNFFQENLRENFWYKNVKLNLKKILMNNNIKSNVFTSIKSTPNYIDIVHVNNLLDSFIIKNNMNNNNNNNDKSKNNNKLNNKTGGFNNKNKEINNNNINKLELNIKKTFVVNNINKNKNENNEYENINKKENNKNENRMNINKNENNKNENRINRNIDENNKNENRMNRNRNNTNKNTDENIRENIHENINKNKNTHENINKNTHENMNKDIHENIQKNINKKINVSKNKLNNLDHNKTEQKENKSINIIKENNQEKKSNEIMRKYSVPKNYKFPLPLCNNKPKCKLTKKQLCQAITDNFIVRNNIIAAILSSIPYKDKNGEYVGGICYQKFLNLEKCKVCVPYDFKNLKGQNMNVIITKILEKADNLNLEDCKNNGGYFLELTKQQKSTLVKKLEGLSEKEIMNNPHLKYNLFFIQFTQKLKNTYFQSLNSLINILQNIQNSPLLSNSTLNKVSFETKNIIDNMYTLVHYYYIFAIISLINADLMETVKQNNSIQNFVSKALTK